MILRPSALGLALSFIARNLRKMLSHAAGLLVMDSAHAYRPELHYMRGPGPKWRAKNALSEPR
jgi:hypothetical protein